jgi:hypothetical protein
VCKERPASLVVSPCGHLCLCVECIDAADNRCPVCKIQARAFARNFVV